MRRKCVTACFLVCAMLFGALGTATAWGETGCPSQGLLIVEEGVNNILTSPNYPGKYGNNENCGWQLTAEEGQRVHVCIMDLKVQYASSCQKDRLILYDGGQPQDNVIATLCGTDSEPEYYSSGNQMYIEFISNYRIRKRGFKLQYTAVGNTTTTAMTTTTTTTTTTSSSSSSQSCPEDGLLTVEQNVEKNLTSPNYPYNYNNDEDCGWKLRAEEGKRVRLTVLDLDLERARRNCKFDKLVIYDGGRPLPYNVIVTLCGKEQQLEYFSSGHEMYVWFYSDLLITKKGFKLQYTAVESTTAATVTPATTRTPSINTTRTTTATTRTTPMHTTRTTTATTRTTPVHTTRTTTTATTRTTTTATTRTTPLHTTRTTTTATTRSTTVNTTSSPSTACPSEGLLTAEPGVNKTLTSPNFPDYYSNNQDCAWTITAGEGKAVHVYVVVLNMEYSLNCRRDKLVLYDGGRPQSDEVLATLCGYNFRLEFSSSGRQMYLNFQSNSLVVSLGFKLRYTAIESTTVMPTTTPIATTTVYGASCLSSGWPDFWRMQRLTAMTGYNNTLTSPNYPFSYPTNLYCGWRIKAPDSWSIVRLYVLDIDMENSTNCSYDSLSFYDGGYKLLDKYCGRYQRVQVLDYGSDVLIKFLSDGTITGRGFKLHYTAVPVWKLPTTLAPTTVTPGQFRCGLDWESSYSHERVVTAEIGRNNTLMSPRYPYSYNNQYCGWKIKAEREGYVVRVYVVALKLDGSCYYDSLSLYDTDTAVSDRLLVKMCGSKHSGKSYYSSGRYMYVQFKTGWLGTIKEFKLLYSAVKRQSGPTTDMPGYVTTHLYALPEYKYLQSEYYPATFYRTERRIWNISCQPGYAVQLRVDDMDLQDSNICTADNTMVVFNSDGYTVLARMCNYQFNGVDLYSTMGRFMYVRLTFAFKTSGKKFSLRYRAVRSSQALFGYTTRAPTTTVPPPESDRSTYNYAFIIAGVIGGCAILGVFICVFCQACLRSKKPPRPRVGRLSTVTFRSGPTSASANGGVYIVPSNRPPATPLDGFTNLAYSEGPPAYSSLQHNHPVYLPAPGESPDPTQLGAAPPTYTETMKMTHPPSRGKEESDGACAQPKGEASPLPTSAVASATPAASFSKPEEPKLGLDTSFDSNI